MGVGAPESILEGVSRGVDMFDCVPLHQKWKKWLPIYSWQNIYN